MVVILLNGPPRCGKDSIANFLAEKHGYLHLSIKEPLVQATVNLFNISREFWDENYETFKEEKLDFLSIFQGSAQKVVRLSPREALIHVSENVIKPSFGEGIFGKITAEKINTLEKNYVISDAGFDKEVIEIVKKLGAKDVYIFKIQREGCSFSKDSRSYLSENSGVLKENIFYFKNDLTLEYFYRDVEELHFSLQA